MSQLTTFFKKIFYFINPFKFIKNHVVYWYIFRTLLPYVLLGIVIFSLINLVQYLVEFIELAVQYGTPVLKVLEIVFYLIPFLMTFTIPVGLFLGIILALGKMGHFNEILALESTGFQFSTIIKPCLTLGILTFLLQISFFEWALPWGNKNFIIARYNIMRSDPMIEIKQKRFFQDGNREIRITSASKDDLYGIYITDKTKNRIYYATQGRISSNYRDNKLFVALENVSSIPYIQAKLNADYSIEHYKKLNFYIQIPKINDLIPQGAELDSISLLYKKLKQLRIDNITQSVDKFTNYIKSQSKMTELQQKLQDVKSQDQKKYLSEMVLKQKPMINLARLDFQRSEMNVYPKEEVFIFHRKLAFSLNSVIMALIAIPLALFKQRQGKEISIIGSVAVIILYNVMLVGIQIVYMDLPFSPIFSAWMPSIVLGVIATALLLNKVKRI